MRKFSPWILEAWATWELLRKLGFASDDIFWEFVNTANAAPLAGLALNVVLKTQDKQFVVTCSPRLTTQDAHQLKDDSVTFQKKILAKEFPVSEMTEVLQASRARTNQAGLVTALQLKGFTFPCAQN